MRRPERTASPELARALFSVAPVTHLASTNPEGEPILRALNVFPFEAADGWSLAFHGAPMGEKLECVGRRAVLSAVEVVANIPSSFTSPERACPATTWYRSAQAHGVLESVEAPEDRAAALNALMRRFQPEGGYRPLSAEDPMYAAAIRNLLVVRLRPDRLDGKVSVGQDKPDETRQAVLRGLWDRGGPGDVAALAASLEYPPEVWPDWLNGPAGVRLLPQLGAGDLPEALPLLRDAEWNAPVSDATLSRAHLGSAWVGARLDGRLVATARAATDGAKFAWLADVYVVPELRGQGIGDAVVRLLLDHPHVRSCARVLLRTRTGERFYGRMGFRRFGDDGGRPLMVRGA